ncbi:MULTISPECIES: TonB-dependent receptor [unclassified Novosphingobium]|uniref:TonB-dependent receptor n=1 Tax=unclassified Novosphingobium TaxID=2644732 RepID=UPI001356A589|nr:MULTISPECIES: TonB-dependent receptor [unclassified Novosphingobium]
MGKSRTARRRQVSLSISVAALALVAGSIAPSAYAEEEPADNIVVTGQRLSATAAIDAKRKAENVVDIISADNLGKLPDANVADALARLPGVSVIVNQDTGEGEYVSIRGLSGTYNAVYINGVRVAQTNVDSRDVSLTVLPPNGLAEIRVTKTLTPDQDGDGIGGSIDFRTPTAFDFKDDTTLRLYANGGFNQQARDAKEDSANYQGQVDFGRRFADDRFGVFVSANYGISHGNGQETENDGEWEPYNWRKNSEEEIDTSNMHLPGIDLDYRRLKQTRFGGNASFDYRGDTTQLYLRGQYSRQEQRGTNDVTDYRNRPTARLTQVNEDDTSLLQPDKAVVGKDAVKGNIYSYTAAQIVDADGDGLITDADAGDTGYWSLNGRSGVWSPQQFQFARNFSTIDMNQTLYTANLGGRSDLGRLHLDYDVSYSGGERSTPQSYSIGYNCDKCAYPLTATGIDWVSADPRFPMAGLPAYARNVERDSSLLPFSGASASRDRQTDKRIAAKLDARYDFDGILDYVKFGGKFMQSKRQYDYTPLYDGDLTGTSLDGLNLAESGLVQKEVTSILGGKYYYGDVFDRSAVVSAVQAAMGANPAGIDPVDLLADDKRGTERVYAGYALTHFTMDELSIIAGARVEHRETHNVFWSSDGDDSGFDSTDRSYTMFLPSLTAIWRRGDKQVYRAAIWTGYSPPEYGYVSGGQTVSRDENNEIVAISRGNPDLKAAQSINADLSAEFYPDATSILSAGLYYKHIKNFIFTNGSQVDAPTQNGSIEITQPQNGETAEIYGIELNMVKTLQGLDSPFDGFGIEGNVTVQHSSAETGLPYREGKPIRFVNTPHLLYNAALTYQKYGVEMKLSYNYRGKYIEDLRDNAVDKWVQPNKSLDFHSRYNFTSHMAMDFDVGNILGGWKYYTTKGDNPSYMKDYMEPGRTFQLRASYIF